MITPGEFTKVRAYLQEFFKLAEINGSLKIEFQEPETVKIDLQTEEAPLLIGEKGETLFGLQSLLKRILTKQLNNGIFVELDVNNYRQKKAKYLQELAMTIADEVSLTQRAKAVEPMSAWERRIIHLTLSDRSDVKTESQGQGEERHVLILPAQEN
jgi:spoIIIJ-associated protein